MFSTSFPDEPVIFLALDRRRIPGLSGRHGERQGPHLLRRDFEEAL